MSRDCPPRFALMAFEKRFRFMWHERKAIFDNTGMLTVYSDKAELKQYDLKNLHYVSMCLKRNSLYVKIIDYDGQKLHLKIRDDVKEWSRRITALQLDSDYDGSTAQSETSSNGVSTRFNE